MHKRGKRRRDNLKQGEDHWAPTRNQHFYMPFREHDCWKTDSGYCSVCRCLLFLSSCDKQYWKIRWKLFLLLEVNSAMHISWTICFQTDYGMDSYILYTRKRVFSKEFFKKKIALCHSPTQPILCNKPFSENSEENMWFSLKGQINTLYIFIWMAQSFVIHGVFTANERVDHLQYLLYILLPKWKLAILHKNLIHI